MRIQTVARHCEVPEQVRKRAEEKAARLIRYQPRLSAVELVFEEVKHIKWVEGVLSVDGIDPVVARGSGSVFPEAVDDVMARLAKILRRERSKARDHQGPRLSELDAVDVESEASAAEDEE